MLNAQMLLSPGTLASARDVPTETMRSGDTASRTPAEPRLVLVTRPTRLAELVNRFNTVAHVRFVLERLGADFEDYRQEDECYGAALAETRRVLVRHGRLAMLDRKLLPSFLFGPQDLVVTLGQDGLVANTLKYLDGQPVLGLNPDPRRWDGPLLPFGVPDLARVLPEAIARRRPTRSVTMAQATLNNGQTLLAVNDLFIGPKSHGSIRYRIHTNGHSENQSSSGIIVSTGLGSTGWLRSLLAGAWALTQQAAPLFTPSNQPAVPPPDPRFEWDADRLCFTVREPFPSRTTGTAIVFGAVSASQPLVVLSQNSENGILFSDGIEQDFVEFNAGASVTVTPASRKGLLVV